MRFPDFKPCLFVVAENGELLSHEPHIEEWLGNRSISVKGQSYKKLLTMISPAWESILPHSPIQLPPSLFLPWEIPEEGEPLFGLNLRQISYEDTYFLTLSSELSRSWADGKGESSKSPLPDALRTLSLRATNAETRLETYMANFPGTFFSQRPDLSFNYLGQGAEELLFQSPEPLYKNGGLFLNALSVQDRDRFVDSLRSNSGTSERFSITYRIRHPDSGEVRYILDVRTALQTPSGMLIGYDGVWLDVTRQAIAENRLSDTVWKENLTHLTNGLAHDFGNLMAGIYSVTDMQLSNIPVDAPMHELLSHIKGSSLQAQKLVRRILDLHKGKETEKSYHDMRELVEDQLDLCKILVARTTKIELLVPKESLPVHIDEFTFRQTILNLTINARDAMGPEGFIQITLRRVEKGAEMSGELKQPMGPAPSHGVVLAFSDTGCGISTDILGKIFQPFFTTKESGKGSGFGLYNVRIFANQHAGKIGVASVPGNGTTFHLYLPIVEE
ncbi:MAG: hypothetical protein HN996_12030 [Opitutae bacterium]|nr:hypothetical protein [Opitutae bacterium]